MTSSRRASHGAALIGAYIALVVTVGLGRSDPLAGQEATDPVEISHTGEDMVLDWDFEPQWIVGGYADTLLGREYAFRPGLVDVDSRDRVYILQQSDFRVVVLSDDGELLRTIGRRGNGPGELADPIGLSVAEDSVLSVFDWANGLVRWHLPTGEPTRVIRIQVRQPPWQPRLHVDSSGFVFTENENLRGADPGSSDHGMRRLNVSRWTPAGVERLATGPAVDRVISEYPSRGIGVRSFPRMFEPVAGWDARDQILAAVVDAEYDIRVFEAYRPVMRIKRTVARRRVTEEMAIRDVNAGWKGRISSSCVVGAEEAVRQMGTAEYLQAVTDLHISPGGNLWALRGRVADEPRMTDVFGPGGEYLGTLPADSPFPLVMMSADRLLVAGADDLDVPTMTMYRVFRQ